MKNKEQMNKYIAILRGINVSGHNMIKMKELQAMFTNMGFTNVITYIQSGNVIFEGNPDTTTGLAERISKEILTTFGCTVPVLVLEGTEIKRVAGDNPFLARPGTDESRLHITFLSAEPAPIDVSALDPQAFLPEEFRVIGRAVYLYCPDGYGNAKLTNSFLERKLKVQATTRNWKTVLELARLSG
jgi:uncharacterized protein (DUF1697 family)